MREDNERVYGADILPKIELAEDVLTGEEAQEFLVSRLADVVTRAWESRETRRREHGARLRGGRLCRRPVFRGKNGRNRDVRRLFARRFYPL